MKKTLVIGAAVGVLALGGAVAYASIPDSNGVIHGCVSSLGTLKVIDSPSQSCAWGSTPLSWNQAGPQGPQGPAGPAGPAGGANVYLHTETGEIPLGTPQGDFTVDCPNGDVSLNAWGQRDGWRHGSDGGGPIYTPADLDIIPLDERVSPASYTMTGAVFGRHGFEQYPDQSPEPNPPAFDPDIHHMYYDYTVKCLEN